METYNEKQIKLKREMVEKRESAYARFNEKSQQLFLEKEKLGRQFDEEKKRLQSELDSVMLKRNQYRAAGCNSTHELMQQSYQEEQAIHRRQQENRMWFFDERRRIARLQETLLDEYRAERTRIDLEKAERHLQIEKEEKERKLLTLQETEQISTLVDANE